MRQWKNHAGSATVATALEADWRRIRDREALQLRGMPAAIRTARRQARHSQVL